MGADALYLVARNFPVPGVAPAPETRIAARGEFTGYPSGGSGLEPTRPAAKWTPECAVGPSRMYWCPQPQGSGIPLWPQRSGTNCGLYVVMYDISCEYVVVHDI